MPTLEQLSFAATPRVRDACMCLHVQRAARAVARRFDEALRPASVTNQQFSLLMGLNRPNPATMRSVASLLAMDRTTLTANLKPLERRGLVKVAVDPDDRRGRLLTLTTAGRAALAKALPHWRRAQEAADAMITGISPEQMRIELRALS